MQKHFEWPSDQKLEHDEKVCLFFDMFSVVEF